MITPIPVESKKIYKYNKNNVSTTQARVRIQKEGISDLKQENQFWSSEIWDSI
jgi:hypothetical protein